MSNPDAPLAEAAAAGAQEPAPRVDLPHRRYGARIGSFHFLLAEGQIYELLPLPSVARLPLSPPELVGMVNVRGVLAPLFDLARLPAPASGEALQHDPAQRPMMLLGRAGSDAFALVVDGFVRTLSDAEPVSLATWAAPTPPALADALGSAWRAAGAVWFEFDLADLLHRRANAGRAPDLHAHVV